MTERRQLGTRGEQIARSHMERQGYTIIEANYRIGRSEIDLIAKKNDTTVFVEVRTRRGSSLGTPEESLNAAKQSRMIAAAESYVQLNNCADWRIDVVAVEMDSSGALLRVEVIENALEL